MNGAKLILIVLFTLLQIVPTVIANYYTGDAAIVYFKDDASDDTIYYRNYTKSDADVGAESVALSYSLSSDAPYKCAADPNTAGFMICLFATTQTWSPKVNLYASYMSNGTWGKLNGGNSISTNWSGSLAMSFEVYDVAYERSGNEAVVVYLNGTEHTGRMKWQVFDGTSLCGENSTDVMDGDIRFIQLYPNPINDYIMAVVANSTAIYTSLWNGTGFETPVYHNNATTLIGTSMIPTFAWESNSGDGILIYDGGSKDKNIEYKNFTTATKSFSAEGEKSACTTVDCYFYGMQAASRPTTDEVYLFFSLATNNGNVSRWTGDGWGSDTYIGLLGGTQRTEMSIACEMGGDNCTVAYTSGGIIKYAYGSGSVWTTNKESGIQGQRVKLKASNFSNDTMVMAEWSNMVYWATWNGNRFTNTSNNPLCPDCISSAVSPRAWDFVYVLGDYDYTAPVVAIDSPSDGAFLNYSPNGFFINGTCSDAGVGVHYAYTNNSIWSIQDINPSEFNFSNQSSLSDGTQYTVQVGCNDTWNNTAFDLVTFTYDITAPTMDFASPTQANGTNKSWDYFEVNVTFVEPSPDTCLVHITNASSANYTMSKFTNTTGGYCEFNATDQNDRKQITYIVYINDSATNLGSSTLRYINLDKTPPTLNITAPSNGSYLNYSHNGFAVNGTCSDSGVGVDYIYTNDTHWGSDTNQDGIFNLTNQSALADGTTCTIQVSCNDTLNNTNSNIVYFTYDDTPPIMDYTNPTQVNNSNKSWDYFVINATFVEIASDTCLVDINNGSAMNYTMSKYTNTTGGYCEFNATTQSDGTINYTVYINDSASNLGSSTLRYINLDSTAPSISNNYTTPVTPKFWSNITITANATDAKIASVNFTLMSPTALYIYNQNGTQYSTDLWNSTIFRTNETGSWYVNITAKDIAGNPTTAEWNFTITDVITYAPHSIVDTIQQGTYDTFNITISHDSSENFNFTLTPYINATAFNISFNESGWGPTCNVNISEGNSVKIETNISVNLIANPITYYGNISINRTDTNTVKNISLEITVSVIPAGDVDLVAPSSWTVNMYTDESETHNYNITNIGAVGALTACNFSLDGDFIGEAFYSFNDSNITLNAGEYKTVKLTISHPTAGTYATNQGIEVECSTVGGSDTLKPEDRVSVDLVATIETLPGAVGGGGFTTTPTINFSNKSMLFEIERYGECISTTLDISWNGPDQTISVTVTGIENFTVTPETSDTIFLKRGKDFKLPVKVCLPEKSELSQEIIKYDQYSWTGEIEFMIKLPTMTKIEKIPITVKKIAFIIQPGGEEGVAPVAVPPIPIIIMGLVIVAIVGIYLFIPPSSPI